MSYFRAPQERPRHLKRFLTVRDVEDAAASGCREIVHADDLVITDAARETAHDLGVAIVKPDPAKRPSAAPSPAVREARTSAPGPTTAAVPAANPSPIPMQANFNGGEHPLVQELVRVIRSRWRPVKRRQRQLLA